MLPEKTGQDKEQMGGGGDGGVKLKLQSTILEKTPPIKLYPSPSVHLEQCIDWLELFIALSEPLC